MSAIRGVYKITNKINQKVYVGSASNVLARFSNHRHNLEKNTHANRHLQASYNRYGLDAFDFSILEECPNAENLRTCEQGWMDKLSACDKDFGYNIAKSPLLNGCSLSDEHIESIRAGLIGKPKSQAHRDKLSAANKGKRLSTETRQKIKDGAGKQNVIKNRDPEFRAKVSNGLKGHAVSDETRRKIGIANSKLRATTPQERDEIRRKRASGIAIRALAREYSVSPSVIRRVMEEVTPGD